MKSNFTLQNKSTSMEESKQYLQYIVKVMTTLFCSFTGKLSCQFIYHLLQLQLPRIVHDVLQGITYNTSYNSVGKKFVYPWTEYPGPGTFDDPTNFILIFNMYFKVCMFITFYYSNLQVNIGRQLFCHNTYQLDIPKTSN